MYLVPSDLKLETLQYGKIQVSTIICAAVSGREAIIIIVIIVILIIIICNTV